MFGVTILGNNSALPAHDRHPTSQAVTLNEQIFLIDCGEGTQMQMARFRVRRSKINFILISHLHGDHYFGLIGLVTSLGLLGREQPLHIFSPSGLQEIIELQVKASDTKLPFELLFHPLAEEGIIVDDKKFIIECFKVSHRIACFGFLIREKKKPRKIDAEKLKQYDVPAAFYEQLKDGKDYVTKTGEMIKNEWVTFESTPPKSYAYCADTVFTESIAEKVKNVTLLYHETTYLKDLEQKAASRFHSTTAQAGKIALLSNAKHLLIGHFSSKYESLDLFFEETKEVFPNVQLAIEGVTYLI
ncbi:MAG: ribonuclease Z [Ilyomonas sp.]